MKHIFDALNKRPTDDLFEPLKAAMALYGIDTELRVSHFLSQLAHESAGFTILQENLNYSADALARVWPKRFRGADGKPIQQALDIARKPERIANIVYAGRMGNDAIGDGWKYRGRGLIQLTGKANYKQASRDLYNDDRLVADPDQVCDLDVAALTAAWFWDRNGLNGLADVDDVTRVTKRINGGIIGLEHRADLLKLAKAAGELA